MNAGRTRRLKGEATEENINVPPELTEEYYSSQAYVEDYMRRHGIKNMGDLTADDFVNMAVERARGLSRPKE